MTDKELEESCNYRNDHGVCKNINYSNHGKRCVGNCKSPVYGNLMKAEIK